MSEYVDTNEGLKAIRAYIVDRVTLVVDNTESMYREVRGAAIAAAQDDMGTGWDRGAFVMMLNGRGGTDRSEVAEVVGNAVCDTIRDWLDLNDPLHVMLADLLDLGDSAQRLMFGEHYMPEEDDWEEEEEEEEEEGPVEDDGPCPCGRSHTRGEHGL